MKKHLSRSWFAGMLVVMFCLVAVLPWCAGGGFYMSNLAQRPFHPLFHSLKPSGSVGHLYGIAGSVMILVGVIFYSVRKRMRFFALTGKMKHILQFHIALCLAGPALIAYHSTFKLGGLVGVGFWSMMAVVASGFIGRYIWIQIPKGIEGHALSIRDLEAENTQLLAQLREYHDFSVEQTHALDRMIDATMPLKGSSLETLWAVAKHDVHLLSKRRALSGWLSDNGVSRDHESACVRIVKRRSILHRRILFLEQLHRLFRFWHVIHVPFTLILLIIFVVHVTTAFLFGYVWGG
jgi:hypothetical protein